MDMDFLDQDFQFQYLGVSSHSPMKLPPTITILNRDIMKTLIDWFINSQWADDSSKIWTNKAISYQTRPQLQQWGLKYKWNSLEAIGFIYCRRN